MSSSKNSPGNPPGHENALTAWATVIGAGLGVIIGLFAGRWLIWAVVLGSTGMVVGGLIDRSRRK